MHCAVLIVAASLLVKDIAIAATLPGHRHVHQNNRRDVVTVTDEEIVYATDIVTVTVNWSPDTSSAVIATTSTPQAAAVILSTGSTSISTSSSSNIPYAAAVTSSKTALTSAKSSSKAATTMSTLIKSSSTTTSTSAAAAKSSSSTSSSSGKRGLSYNTASLTSAFIGDSKVTWAYNWGSSSSGLSSSFEYIPMLWGLGSSSTSTWVANANAAIASGSTHLVAFNEPDLAAQSNIGYSDAAAGYKTYMQPFAGKAKLGSPSVTNGASPMGLTYLKNFMSACTDCQVDFCAIHWYDSATNIDYFKSYMAEAYTACNNKPIWVTEFGATGTDAQIATFLATVMPWMDAQSYIERYAYFMASDGILLSGTALSTVGKAYVA